MEGILTALDYIQRVRFAGSELILCLTYWRSCWTLFESSRIIFHSYQQWMKDHVLHIPVNTYYCFFLIFDHSHPIGCGIVLPGFEFHFPNNQWCLASSCVLIGHLLLFFGETSIFRSWDRIFSNLLLAWIKDTMLTTCLLLFPAT